MDADPPSVPDVPAGQARPRRYESPLRRQRAALTTERIVDAGCALVRGLPTWDWRRLTFRAVAAGAGVSERTVYRHFATERDLRDAVMRRLEREAGVDVEGLDLAEFAQAAARAFAHLPASSGDPAEPEPEPAEDAAAADDARRRESIVSAVASAAAGWSDDECRMAAAVLDVLWSVSAHERLIKDWRLDGEQASAAIRWAMGLLVEAVRGRSPATG